MPEAVPNPDAMSDHGGRRHDGNVRCLEGASSRATLDLRAQTLTFEHHGSITTEQQKALSPLVVPLGAIASVECQRGRSTNWFWVVRRGQKPWRKGVATDPCGVMSVVDPLDFVEQVKAAVMRAAPVEAEPDAPVPAEAKASGIAKWIGRGVVDGFFNTR